MKELSIPYLSTILITNYEIRTDEKEIDVQYTTQLPLANDKARPTSFLIKKINGEWQCLLHDSQGQPQLATGDVEQTIMDYIILTDGYFGDDEKLQTQQSFSIDLVSGTYNYDTRNKIFNITYFDPPRFIDSHQNMLGNKISLAQENGEWNLYKFQKGMGKIKLTDSLTANIKQFLLGKHLRNGNIVWITDVDY